MIKKFLRVNLEIPVPIRVGPIDIPIDDDGTFAGGGDPDDEYDIVAAAREIAEDALAGALPNETCEVCAYPDDHPLRGEWVPVSAELGDVDWGDQHGYTGEILVSMTAEVEHDLPDPKS